MAFDYQKNKLDYQQLVLKQIERIQNISAKELRDSTKTIKNLIGDQLIESEDTRYSYLQSIDVLGSLLKPWFGKLKVKFDEEELEISKQFDEYCQLYEMELVEASKDKDFQDMVREFFGKEIVSMDQTNQLSELNIFFLNHKIKMGRRMFRSLIQAFKEADFLGSESFSEGDSGDSSMVASGDDLDDIGTGFEE